MQPAISATKHLRNPVSIDHAQNISLNTILTFTSYSKNTFIRLCHAI